MKPAWGKIAVIALGVAALAAAWRFTPLKEVATAENVLGWARAVRELWWAPLAVVAAYIVGALVLFPRPLITLATIITFGVWLGLAYAVAGVLAAALVTYYAGRMLKRETVRRLAGERFEKASKPVKRHGVIAIFAANMLPTPPFAVQNMMAGAIRVPVLHFAAGTLLSILPTAIAWAVFGDQLAAALDDESEVSWGMVAAAIAGLAVFFYFVRRWLKKQGF